jgi:hypothetical protein
VVFERLGIAGVKGYGAQGSGTVSFHHGFCRGGIDVTQRDVIITRLRQQSADEGADLPGSQNENFVHEYLVWR